MQLLFQGNNLERLPLERRFYFINAVRSRCSWDHLLHSSSGSIEKARRLLDYLPRYSSLDAIKESLSWSMKDH